VAQNRIGGRKLGRPCGPKCHRMGGGREYTFLILCTLSSNSNANLHIFLSLPYFFVLVAVWWCPASTVKKSKSSYALLEML